MLAFWNRGLYSKLVLSFLLVSMMFYCGSATEIESGYLQVTSEGSVTEEIGFRPDYIEFISSQQIESINFEDNVPTNNNCPQNVNGWSEGSALFDSEGTSASDVDKQFSIGAFRNSDSTNDHRVAASTSDVVKNVYTGRNGGKCGELRISVIRPTSNGFELDVESKYSNYDEIVRYKAYQFPDNMPFDAGMVKIDSNDPKTINTGFQPANIHIRAAQQISSKNIDTQFEDNNPEEDNTLGRSKGYATLDEDGNVIDQQSIGTASSSDSTNAHRSIASDEYVLNTAYVGQDANLFGRLRAKITGADSSSFSMQIDDKWSGTDDVFLYRAWGFSYYDFQIGYKTISSEGTQSFSTGFEPDAIDIYAEQQIDSINNEVTTLENSGCDNAGGWSNGYYETDDDREWSISTGRTSDSQNSHRMGSSTNYALKNLYSGQNGNDCGNFQGSVTSVDNNGFEMDFSYDSNFDTNYGSEMVYYRALNFRLAPPTVENIRFYNKSSGHSFGVEANISEGSNDISDCDVAAESSSGSQESYSATITKINSTYSQCNFEWINYDDNSNWKSRHDDDDELISLDVTVTASDVDGQSSQSTKSNTFPNHKPSVESVTFSNYTSFHGFDVSSVLRDSDAEDSEEIKSCEFAFSDDDGAQIMKNSVPDHAVGNSQESGCTYSNVNSSMPYPSGIPIGQGFEVLEPINVEINVTDHHNASEIGYSSNTIPNSPPYADNPAPLNESYISEFPVDLSATVYDAQGDEINATIYAQGSRLNEEFSLNTGGEIEHTWNLPDARYTEYNWVVETEDYWESRNTTFSFVKIIGQRFRSRVRTDLNYSSLIMNAENNKYSKFTIRNDVSNTKNLTVSLSGVSAEFLNGEPVKQLPSFPGNSQETYTLRITPDSPTSDDLTVTVRNNDLGVNTTTSIPVRVLENYRQSSRDVPGIGIIQLFVLSSVSLVFYFKFM